jgi:hypothetical protein
MFLFFICVIEFFFQCASVWHPVLIFFFTTAKEQGSWEERKPQVAKPKVIGHAGAMTSEYLSLWWWMEKKSVFGSAQRSASSFPCMATKRLQPVLIRWWSSRNPIERSAGAENTISSGPLDLVGPTRGRGPICLGLGAHQHGPRVAVQGEETGMWWWREAEK